MTAIADKFVQQDVHRVLELRLTPQVRELIPAEQADLEARLARLGRLRAGVVLDGVVALLQSGRLIRPVRDPHAGTLRPLVDREAPTLSVRADDVPRSGRPVARTASATTAKAAIDFDDDRPDPVDAPAAPDESATVDALRRASRGKRPAAPPVGPMAG